jgi:glycosyltransferase involved in cell wall biosynthesis
MSPYLTPVFERLARRPSCEVLVVYETAMEPSRRWEIQTPSFEYEVMESWTVNLASLAIGAGFKERADAYLYVPKHPLAALSRFAPDVVIASGAGIWSSPANLIALAARRRYGWAFVPWWGSFRRARPTVPRRLAEPLVRAFVRAGDAWMVYGARSAADVLRLGADPSRTVVAPLVGRHEPKLNQPLVSRATHDPFRFLFVGRLIERKGVEVLLAAFREIEAAELWIAGDGPLLGRVEEAARRDGRVRLFGHADMLALDDLYRSADALVLPSYHDVWGLVVNEAQAYGLPVIATEEVGAAADLIDPGVNGFIIPAGSPSALEHVMKDLRDWTDEQQRRAAARSVEKLAGHSLDDACDAFVRASRIALEHKRRPARTKTGFRTR